MKKDCPIGRSNGELASRPLPQLITVLLITSRHPRERSKSLLLGSRLNKQHFCYLLRLDPSAPMASITGAVPSVL
jgi:hypothetical protein